MDYVLYSIVWSLHFVFIYCTLSLQYCYWRWLCILFHSLQLDVSVFGISTVTLDVSAFCFSILSLDVSAFCVIQVHDILWMKILIFPYAAYRWLCFQSDWIWRFWILGQAHCFKSALVSPNKLSFFLWDSFTSNLNKMWTHYRSWARLRKSISSGKSPFLMMTLI